MTAPNIALTGRLRSGKDAVAAYLTERYGYTRFAFGDGIRRVTRELYPEAYEGGAKPRALLQGFGQMARMFDESVWVNDCFRRISVMEHVRRLQPDGTFGNGVLSYVITDLRQPNEFDRCRAEGYVIVRVNCPDEIRLQRAKDAGDSFTNVDLTHDTESHVDTFAVDYEIDNAGTLAELYAQVDAIMAEVSA